MASLWSKGWHSRMCTWAWWPTRRCTSSPDCASHTLIVWSLTDDITCGMDLRWLAGVVSLGGHNLTMCQTKKYFIQIG